jgi:hypothetical protein
MKKKRTRSPSRQTTGHVDVSELAGMLKSPTRPVSVKTMNLVIRRKGSQSALLRINWLERITRYEKKGEEWP